MTVPNSITTIPTWLKVVAALGVIWYVFGLAQFFMAVNTDTAAAVSSGAMTTDHAVAIDGTPSIIWLAFALASGLGIAGSIALLMKSSLAKLLFLGSLLSAVIYYAWVYVISGTGGARPSEEIGITAMVLIVTIIFTWLARRFT